MILFSQRQNKASERNILICYGTWYSAILDVADKADEVSVMHRVHHILKIKFKDFRGKVWDTYRGKYSSLFVCNVHHRFIAGSDLWHMRCVSIWRRQSSKLHHSGEAVLWPIRSLHPSRPILQQWTGDDCFCFSKRQLWNYSPIHGAKQQLMQFTSLLLTQRRDPNTVKAARRVVCRCLFSNSSEIKPHWQTTYFEFNRVQLFHTIRLT